MLKIVAIGGGEIGQPGTKIEIENIDKEIIRLSGKKRPRLLFIPTASGDSESYYNVVKKYFGKRLGCQTDVIYLIKKKYSKNDLENKVFNSDIIYVGGGNTLFLLKQWRKAGLDQIILRAAKKGIVLSGISAGSICWFKYGLSDSRKYRNQKANLIRVSGLNLIKALHTPHYHFEPKRIKGLKKITRKTTGVAIAIDNCCALEVVGDQYRILKTRASAYAYKVYWKNNKYFVKKIKESKEFAPLINILTK